MAGITIEIAEAKLALWLEADSVVATGQAYSIGTRSLTRANGDLIRKNIEFWNNKVIELTDGLQGIVISQVVPYDD